MKINNYIIFIIFFLSFSRAYSNDQIGFWIAVDHNLVIEINESTIYIYDHDLEIDYSFIENPNDDSGLWFTYQKGNALYPSYIYYNKSEDTILFKGEINNITNMRFSRAPKIRKKDYMGKWYEHWSDSVSDVTYEQSSIITMSGECYDMETLEIDHIKRTYNYLYDKNICFKFEKGFIFVEKLSDGSDYRYYVKEFTPDKIIFIDATEGNVWEQAKRTPLTHTPIPPGYEKAKQ